MVYELYTLAKKALSTGTAVCHEAKDVAKNTDALILQTVSLGNHNSSVIAGLAEQLNRLHAIEELISRDEQGQQIAFRNCLTELDVLDVELNEALQALRETRLAPELNDTRPNDEPGVTLITFADEMAIETLQGQLREAIDVMHDMQVAIARTHEEHKSSIDRLVIRLSELRDIPLPMRDDAEIQEASLKRDIDAIHKTYTAGQEDSLHEMADLLVQLSQHYDHASTLFTSDVSLPDDEHQELLQIVQNDAKQLVNVQIELNDRLQDLHLDLNEWQSYWQDLDSNRQTIYDILSDFEKLDLNSLKNAHMSQRNEVEACFDDINNLKSQMLMLGKHYRAFHKSYYAMLLEIDRRSRYEHSMQKYIQQTNETLARLSNDESTKREAFLRRYAETLPQDIWTRITDLPTVYKMENIVINHQPNLSHELLEVAYEKLSI